MECAVGDTLWHIDVSDVAHFSGFEIHAVYLVLVEKTVKAAPGHLCFARSAGDIALTLAQIGFDQPFFYKIGLLFHLLTQ